MIKYYKSKIPQMPALSRDLEVHEEGRSKREKERRRVMDTGAKGREWRRWNGDAAGPGKGDERESRGTGVVSVISTTPLCPAIPSYAGGNT